MSNESNFIWEPSDDILKNSNLARFINYCGCKNFDDLRLRAIEDLEWFWNAVSCFLRIQWIKPYSRVMDSSEGIQWTKWFIDGKINIAQNCLEKQQLNLSKKTALISETESGATQTLTYSQLLTITNKIANALSNTLGVRKGDKIGIYMPLIQEAVASFLAVIKLGAIVVPLFSGYGPEAIATRLSDCDAVALITAEKFERRGKTISMRETALQGVRSVPSMRSVLVFGQSRDQEQAENQDRTGGIREFDWSIVEKSDSSRVTEEMDSEDPFMIIYTSGTTGKPKGAVHVHGGFLVKVAEEVSFQIDLRPDDVQFWITDMGWIMAPWEIVGVLTLGGTLLIYDGAPDYPEPDRLWEIVDKFRVTSLGISPTLVRALMKHGTAPLVDHKLTSLRKFGSTGEPWNPDPYLWLFENVGKGRCPIVNLAGGTEVGACFLSVHTILPIKTCSVGVPVLGIDADVLDERGNPVRGLTGELAVKKPWPSMTRGLWKANNRYIETYWSRFPNVWIHGDWASIDSDGYWYLHGRSDDTIKIAGKRLGPTEVESVLSSHPSVLESVAIGVPDELKGEAIVCFVILRPDFSPSDKLATDLTDHVANALGRPLKPKRIEFVNSIPKTRNAKLVRRLVKAKYLNQPLGDTTNLENPESLKVIPSSS
ncbi:MAG TPA: AMP-binding protein [Nitrososphaerales archaeon]|nr:AMP-binding protein [Nitrososphaerales archaeon]